MGGLRETFSRWAKGNHRGVVGAVILIGGILGASAAWYGVAAWKAAQVEQARADFSQRIMATTADLNTRIDGLLQRVSGAENDAARQDLLAAVAQMTERLANLEAEAETLRAQLADTDPWQTGTRDAVANTLFRIESLRERAEAVTIRQVLPKPVAKRSVVSTPETKPGTATMIATPDQLRRARAIGAAYHRRQVQRFAEASSTRLRSSAGSLTP